MDGTEVDFSYIKCVANLYPEAYPLSLTRTLFLTLTAPTLFLTRTLTPFLTPTRPRCVANLYPETSEGGKGGGQRKGDRKRKAEAAADADTG